MTVKHQISNAEVLTRGDIGHKPYMATKGLESRRGVIVPNIAVVEYGAVDALDADGVSVSQTPAGAGSLTITGALATSSVATFDVPRNVTVTSVGNETGRTFTVTGTDEYGVAMVEAITGANAGVAAGKKAFKTVTDVSVDAATAGAVTVGTGDVLGLPYRIDGKGQIISCAADGSVEDATIVIADTTDPATATDGDVRGTVDFTTAANGTVEFTVMMIRKATSDPNAMFGVDQYSA